MPPWFAPSPRLRQLGPAPGAMQGLPPSTHRVAASEGIRRNAHEHRQNPTPRRGHGTPWTSRQQNAPAAPPPPASDARCSPAGCWRTPDTPWQTKPGSPTHRSAPACRPPRRNMSRFPRQVGAETRRHGRLKASRPHGPVSDWPFPPACHGTARATSLPARPPTWRLAVQLQSYHKLRRRWGGFPDGSFAG